MATTFTSRVFDAARKMRDRLREQSLPAHPITGNVPQIALTEPDWDTFDEVVWIWPDFGDDAEINWQRFPNGRDETFSVVVAINTFAVYDAQAEDLILDRLEELADVVQRAVYDDTSGAASETARLNPLGVDGVVANGGISQVSFEIVPSPREGLIGRCLVRYEHVGRI
jgi:hypothetical protein